MDSQMRLWLICVTLSLLGIIPIATDWSFPNNAQTPMLKFLEDGILGIRNTTAKTTSTLIWTWFISCAQIANVLASFFAPLFAEVLGRPKAMTAALLVSVFGHLFQSLSQFVSAWPLLFIGRFINSLGSIIFNTVMPIYLSEIAPPRIRGKLGITLPIAMLCGVLIAAIFGLPEILGNSKNWPFAYLFCFLLGLIPIGVTFFWIKETPVYLLARGREKEAHQSLVYYRGHDDDLTLVEIDAESKKRGLHPGLTAFYHLIRAKPLRRSVLIGILVVVAYNAARLFNSYSTAIFKEVGFSDETAPYLTLALQMASIFSFVICFALVDRYGRRPLVLVGLLGGALGWLGMFVCQMVITLTASPDIKRTAAIVFCVPTFIAQIFVNIGIRPVYWILIPEIFPYNFRSVGKAFSIFCQGVLGFVFLQVYYSLLGSFAPAAHLFMALALLVALVYLYFNLPETKGKAPHEIFPEFLDLPTGEKTPLLASNNMSTYSST